MPTSPTRPPSRPAHATNTPRPSSPWPIVCPRRLAAADDQGASLGAAGCGRASARLCQDPPPLGSTCTDRAQLPATGRRERLLADLVTPSRAAARRRGGPLPVAARDAAAHSAAAVSAGAPPRLPRALERAAPPTRRGRGVGRRQQHERAPSWKVFSSSQFTLIDRDTVRDSTLVSREILACIRDRTDTAQN